MKTLSLVKNNKINATKSTGSSSNVIEVDVDTILSIRVHPDLKTVEIDHGGKYKMTFGSKDTCLQTLNGMGCRLDSLMISLSTIKNIYFIDHNLELTFTIKWAVSLEEDPLTTYRFRSKDDYEKFSNMVEPDGTDIPDPELYGGELVVVDKAEKAVCIKRMDERSAVKLKMSPKLKQLRSMSIIPPQVIYRDRGNNWIRIFIMDDNSKGFDTSVKETTKLQAVFSDYADHTGISLKSIHRVKLNGRNIFLSQAKQMTMKEIGVKEGDVFHVPPVPTPHVSVLNPSEKSRNNAKAAPAKSKKTSTQPQPTRRTQWAGVTEDTSSKEYLIKLHSIKMEKVWKEAEPKFDEIRKKLADLNIKREEPKERLPKENKKKIAPVNHNISSVVELGKDLRRGSFIINVGCEENLYKTYKQDKCTKSQPLYTLDLHGKTREQALSALNENLPSWIETAMLMEDPFVIQVKIVCGKGSQTLCEEVERWIKREKNVSNAPKRKN